MACMMFGSTLATNATGTKIATKAPGDKSSKTLASSRAKHLSDQMIRGVAIKQLPVWKNKRNKPEGCRADYGNRRK